MDIIHKIRQVTLDIKETLVVQSSDPPVMVLDIEYVERLLDELAVELSKPLPLPASWTGGSGVAVPRRARAMHEFFPENLRNPAYNRRVGLMRQFSSGQLYSIGNGKVSSEETSEET